MSNSPLVTRRWPADPSNYTKGRDGNHIRGIVIHHAASTNFNSIGTVFARAGRNGSAHYGIDGNRVDQYVDEADTAWHCGNWLGNTATVGIECTNTTGAPDWRISDATFETLVKLVADIARRNNLGRIKFDPDGVYPTLSAHRDWSATECPGNYLYGRMKELETRVNNLNYPPKPTAPTWSNFSGGDFVAKTGRTVTNLYDVMTGKAIKTYTPNDKIHLVQKTNWNGVEYYRTAWSASKGINHGFKSSEMMAYKEPAVEAPEKPAKPVEVPNTDNKATDDRNAVKEPQNGSDEKAPSAPETRDNTPKTSDEANSHNSSVLDENKNKPATATQDGGGSEPTKTDENKENEMATPTNTNDSGLIVMPEGIEMTTKQKVAVWLVIDALAIVATEIPLVINIFTAPDLVTKGSAAAIAVSALASALTLIFKLAKK